MAGKLIGIAIVGTALIFGAVVYYFQVYHFYERLPATGLGDVSLTASASGQPIPIRADDFEAIDASSSPIRYRACFTTTVSQQRLAAFEPYEGAEPRNAPSWFGCFDADGIGAAIAAGTAQVFTGQRNLEFGIDRVVAITEDGRGYVWHEINDCGDKAYDGSPLGEDCPERP